MRIPVNGDYEITAAYGDANVKLWGKTGHKGIDIIAADKRIVAAAAGTVRVVSYDADGYGQYVTIGTADNRIHIYAHLVQGSVLVSVGEKVKEGQQLGTMGATGNVTGVHLHYQINSMQGVPQNPTGPLGIPNKRGKYTSAPAHWAKEHYDALVARGVLDGGDTSAIWRQFDAKVSDITIGQLLALINKATRD